MAEIYNSRSNSLVNGTSGDDYIQNWGGSNVTIEGGAGNDNVLFHYSNDIENLVELGAGDDTFSNNWDFSKNRSYGNNGSNVLFKYNVGDGNDVIYGFKDNSTLSIAGGQYVSFKSGNDIIVTAQDGGRITLVGAAKLSKVNIVAKQIGILVDGYYLNNQKNALIVGTDSDNIINHNIYLCEIQRHDSCQWRQRCHVKLRRQRDD